jgi:hypothetical protein
MRVDRSSTKAILTSWLLLVTLVTLIVLTIYGKGWVDATKESHPFTVRLKLIALVAIISLAVDLLIRAAPGFTPLRVPLTWGLVSFAVTGLGMYFADHFFYPLEYEGWGLMFPLLGILLGARAAVREGFEKR